MMDKLQKAQGWLLILGVAAVGVLGFIAYRRIRQAGAAAQQLTQEAGQSVSSAIISTVKPSGVYNTAAEASSAYMAAVNEIVKKNPQFTPIYVKKVLARVQWKIGDKVPPEYGIRT